MQLGHALAGGVTGIAKGRSATATSDFQSNGIRPAPRKRTLAKPASTRSCPSVLLLQNLMCPPACNGFQWESNLSKIARARFFRYPWYGVEQISHPPAHRAWKQLDAKRFAS